MSSHLVWTVWHEESSDNVVSAWANISLLHILPDGRGEANVGIVSYSICVVVQFITSVISFIEVSGEVLVILFTGKGHRTSCSVETRIINTILTSGVLDNAHIIWAITNVSEKSCNLSLASIVLIHTIVVIGLTTKGWELGNCPKECSISVNVIGILSEVKPLWDREDSLNSSHIFIVV